MSELQYTLPASVATQQDLRRLMNEVERIDNALVEAEIHQRTGHSSDEELVLSRQLGDFVAANEIDIKDGGARAGLITALRQLKDSAPVVHVTFAASAGRDELAKLVDWVRQSVHPQAVLTIGLSPELIGGAYVRTTNKVFDLSVRSQLAEGRQIIQKELEALSGAV